MRTRPLTLIAVGVLLVALDFRVVAADVLPDAVGWLLVAFGSARLGLRGPAGLAAVAAAAGVADVFAPYRRVALDPLTGQIVPEPGPGTAYDERLDFERLTDLRLVLVLAALVAGGLALWFVLGSLRTRAQAAADDRSARRLGELRWLVAGAWVLPYVVVAIVQVARDGGFDPVWNGGLELLALVGLAVAAALAWRLLVSSNRRWSAPVADPALLGS